QAWSIESLIGLRFLQGMGGSRVMATTFAIVASVFPPGERGKARGIAVASVYAGISCGPFFGGVLVNTFGWRAIFYLVVPLGLITFAVSWFQLRGEWAESRGEPFDWQGSLIYAVAILMLITGASNLDRGHWAWALALAGMAGIALFLRFEAKAAYPVLDVALLRRNRVFAFSNLAALLNYAATFGVTFFLSLYLQFVKGEHQCGQFSHPGGPDADHPGPGLCALLVTEHQRHHGQHPQPLSRSRLRSQQHHAHTGNDGQYDRHYHHFFDPHGRSGGHAADPAAVSRQHAYGTADLLWALRDRDLLVARSTARRAQRMTSP
ncbi:MAG: MFS transporter, partial [Desulfuromonadales bacterium]